MEFETNELSFRLKRGPFLFLNQKGLYMNENHMKLWKTKINKQNSHSEGAVKVSQFSLSNEKKI